MAKLQKKYFCNNCGAEAPKWLGKCPECGQWNTFVEEIISKESKSSFRFATDGQRNVPVPLSRVEKSDYKRTVLENGEVNRVLGGGIVPGSLVLLGGDPGIG